MILLEACDKAILEGARGRVLGTRSYHGTNARYLVC
jgi:hypothetical protein